MKGSLQTIRFWLFIVPEVVLVGVLVQHLGIVLARRPNFLRVEIAGRLGILHPSAVKLVGYMLVINGLADSV